MTDKLLSIVRAAGELMLSFRRPETYQKEGHANFVTQADLAVQSFLIEKLREVLPEAVFLAEEQENPELSDAPTFIIDPIDGTTNFIRGRRCSAISVALVKNREAAMGIVLNPYNNEAFHAQKGMGAFLNGEPIHISQIPFSQALVSFGTSPYRTELASQTLRTAERFLLAAADLRRTGSAALDLCDVACGRSDVFWELSLSPWDFAAGALIVQEAGGIVGCPGGDPLPLHRKSAVLAANPLCFLPAQALLLEQT